MREGTPVRVRTRRLRTFEPLSGVDAGFLYMETPSLHMHTLKVAIMDTSRLRSGISFAFFRQVFEEKLQHLPSFRQRAVEIPLGLWHPVWAPDPDFDLSRHLKYRRLEAPGGRSRLEAAVSEIASTGLSRSRPLWEITMIEGLAEERVAFVCKIHHSMADGSAALEMLLRVLQESTPLEPLPEQGLPTRLELILHAARQVWRRVGELPELALQTLYGIAAWIARARANKQSALPRPFSGPVVSFNAALTPDRIFRTASLPLEDLKRVRRALGVTLNDVVLGICAGALRAHLLHHGELPERSLVAGVPVNTRPGERGRARGNHVGHLMTLLFTDVADPVQRIRAIHDVTLEARTRQAALGLDLSERWFEYTPPRPYTATVRFWSGHRIADRLPPPMNLVVSNVAGPAESLTIAGARLEALYSVGPILEGIGLNLTAWSYAGQMNFVALACPQHVPDLAELCARLPVALAELLRACGPRPADAETPGEVAAQPLAEAATPQASPTPGASVGRASSDPNPPR